MISGLDLNATVDFTLKEDIDNPTIWKLGIIPSYLFAKISSEAAKDQIETAYKILQIAIKGWENFDIPFEAVQEDIFGRIYSVVPISVLERFPLKVITELSMKVMEINQITAVESKN